jgi:hypothetical protein
MVDAFFAYRYRCLYIVIYALYIIIDAWRQIILALVVKHATHSEELKDGGKI